MNRRILQAVVGVATSALVVTAAPAAPVSAHGSGHGHSQGHGAVTGKAVHRHLQAFQRIADANDNNRATGTSGYEESARYVERTLRRAGYRPERQYFEVETFRVLNLDVSVPGVPLEPIAMSYSNSTVEGGVTEELVAPTDPLGCTTDAWSGVDVAGKIAVVSRGSCAFGEKAAAAGEAGAAALIIYNNAEGALNGTLGEPNTAAAPVVGVTQAEGAALLAAMGSGTVTGTFDLQTAIETAETFNVIAETRGGDPDNVVMAGAHLDSTEEGPGINDNGTGSAAILETAVQLAKGSKGHRGKGHRSKINNKVRFAWWGAEELGLHGSNHYVADLQANDPAALEKIAVYLNFDMVGSPNYIIGVYDANESTYPAPVPVPEGSAAAEAAFTDYFDSIDQPWVDTEFSGRSDYQAFIEADVPSTGLFTGADDVKTEEEVALFGGTAGITHDPNYHSAADDIDNVSKEALDIMSRAIGEVVSDLAYSTEAINGVKPPKHKHDKKDKRKDKKKGHKNGKKKGPKRGR